MLFERGGDRLVQVTSP